MAVTAKRKTMKKSANRSRQISRASNARGRGSVATAGGQETATQKRGKSAIGGTPSAKSPQARAKTQKIETRSSTRTGGSQQASAKTKKPARGNQRRQTGKARFKASTALLEGNGLGATNW